MYPRCIQLRNSFEIKKYINVVYIFGCRVHYFEGSAHISKLVPGQVKSNVFFIFILLFRTVRNRIGQVNTWLKLLSLHPIKQSGQQSAGNKNGVSMQAVHTRHGLNSMKRLAFAVQSSAPPPLSPRHVPAIVCCCTRRRRNKCSLFCTATNNTFTWR